MSRYANVGYRGGGLTSSGSDGAALRANGLSEEPPPPSVGGHFMDVGGRYFVTPALFESLEADIALAVLQMVAKRNPYVAAIRALLRAAAFLQKKENIWDPTGGAFVKTGGRSGYGFYCNSGEGGNREHGAVIPVDCGTTVGDPGNEQAAPGSPYIWDIYVPGDVGLGTVVKVHARLFPDATGKQYVASASQMDPFSFKPVEAAMQEVTHALRSPAVTPQQKRRLYELAKPLYEAEQRTMLDMPPVAAPSENPYDRTREDYERREDGEALIDAAEELLPRKKDEPARYPLPDPNPREDPRLEYSLPRPNPTRHVVRKFKGRSLKLGMAEAIGESKDALECAWDAIPKWTTDPKTGKRKKISYGDLPLAEVPKARYFDAKTKKWVTRKPLNDKGKPITHPRVPDMAKDVLNHYKDMDWHGFTECMGWQQVSDAVIGLLSGQTSKKYGQKTSRSVGIGVGPAL